MRVEYKVGDTMKLQEALTELRKQEKRKFEQSVDLIVNLKGIDVKKESINFVASLPHKIKDKKVCAFLKEKSNVVPTVTEVEFIKYKDKKTIKKFVQKYDFFIASAPLMPKVASTFGKVLGPAGKMPSPQLGILTQENEKEIKNVIEKISRSVKVRVKEASIKIMIGKENVSDSELEANARAVYHAVENALPKKKENVRNVMIKFTMTKAIRVEVER